VMRTTAASADAAKEAVAKVRREGLRLDVCSAVVVPAGVHEAAPRWRTLQRGLGRRSHARLVASRARLGHDDRGAARVGATPTAPVRRSLVRPGGVARRQVDGRVPRVQPWRLAEVDDWRLASRAQRRSSIARGTTCRCRSDLSDTLIG
jgi:hypothetical protein